MAGTSPAITNTWINFTQHLAHPMRQPLELWVEILHGNGVDDVVATAERLLSCATMRVLEPAIRLAKESDAPGIAAIYAPYCPPYAWSTPGMTNHANTLSSAAL